MRRPISASIRTPGSDPPDHFSDELKEGFARWASGVAVLAAGDGEEVDAITVTAFTPVSVDPPLLLVSVAEHASVLPMVRQEGRFTVSLLAEGQRDVASAVADRMPDLERYFVGEHAPRVEGALAVFECELEVEHGGGDHRLVMGRIGRVIFAGEDPPLLYFKRDYRRMGGRAGRS